jgi:hypothetical protein
MHKVKNRILFTMLLANFLAGCALTHEEIAARAKKKSNSELCMATIQFPQYGNEIAEELAARGHTCDWAITAAQIRAQDEQDARYRAALQAATTPNNGQSGYQIAPPVQLSSRPISAPVLPTTGVTAIFTGKQQQVQTVTSQYGWNCEYNYLGRTFWRTFVGSCPSSVQVQ